MTCALILTDDPPAAATLGADLDRAGVPAVGACDCHTLVRRAVETAPDVVIAWSERPTAAWFDALETLGQVSPCPVVMFTQGDDVEAVERGIAAGIHAYVVGGYSASRLRSSIHVAQARFRAEQALKAQLAELRGRLEERRLIDRAKGILMRAPGVTEEEAFHTLRSASQRGNRRVGEVAHRLIDAARASEAVNRSGQLRMLSQRIVKLQALRAAGVEATGAIALLAQSRARVRVNLETIETLVSMATLGDLLSRVRESWRKVESALEEPAVQGALGELDRRAERLKADADSLVTALGGADPASGLHAVNVCGRQRMLSQRLAKQALLGALLDPPDAAAARAAAGATVIEFEASLKALRGATQGTPEIEPRLQGAAAAWRQMQATAARAETKEGRLELAASSEAVLEAFETLTDQLERSLPVLLGPAGGR